jgi:protease IV
MGKHAHPILYGLLWVLLSLAGLMILGSAFVFWFDEDRSWKSEPRIGVVVLRGVILDSKNTVDLLKKYRKDDRVKAIIVRVDSPGGSVAASQEIYREIVRTLPLKKVVISMGNVAASGGYYVAVAGNRIMANPGTLTGSIGVVMQFSNVQELMQKIGVSLEVVKSGAFKDIGSPARKMKAEERLLLEGVIRNVHQQFVDTVAQARRLPKPEVEKLADGRIFTGEQAKTLGLVDELGSMEEAVEMTKKLARISGEVKLVYPEKKKFSLWDLIVNRVMGEIRENLPFSGSAFELLWVPPAFYRN